MTDYIDAFVLSIPRDRLKEYKLLIEAAAEIWIEHGALEYREFIGDDLKRDGTRSFTEFADASGDDVIVFGWVKFKSRAIRDLANERVEADPRMPELIDATSSGFDAERMMYGGFKSLVQTSSSD